MTMRRKAILVPANPYDLIDIGGKGVLITRDLGDVEKHIEHLKAYGGVIWGMWPPGGRSFPWKHPEIRTGYFYIAKDQVVRYKFELMSPIRRLKDFSKSEWSEVEKYLPPVRKQTHEILADTIGDAFMLIIKSISRLRKERRLNEFKRWDNGMPVKMCRNYVIIEDPGYT